MYLEMSAQFATKMNQRAFSFSLSENRITIKREVLHIDRTRGHVDGGRHPQHLSWRTDLNTNEIKKAYELQQIEPALKFLPFPILLTQILIGFQFRVLSLNHEIMVTREEISPVFSTTTFE